jgi:hypothetical protein
MSRFGRDLPPHISPNRLREYYGSSKNANRVLWGKLESYHYLVDELLGGIPEYHIYLKAISPHYQRIFKGWVVTYITKLLALYRANPQWFQHDPENMLKANFVHIKSRLFSRLYIQADKIGLPLNVNRKNVSIPYKHLCKMSSRFTNELWGLSNLVESKLVRP